MPRRPPRPPRRLCRLCGGEFYSWLEAVPCPACKREAMQLRDADRSSLIANRDRSPRAMVELDDEGLPVGF